MLQIINGSEMYLSYIWKIVAQTTGLQFRSSRPEVFCKKGVLRNFTKFTEKHLARVSFLKKLQASGLRWLLLVIVNLVQTLALSYH